MTLKANICNALTEWLRKEYPKLKVWQVTDYEEDTRFGGYCETCSYTEIVIDIEFVDAQNKRKNFTYDGSFADLLYRLDR